MPDEHIKTDSNGGVLTVTLARSDKKNALIDSMYGALADALEAAENDPSIRVVLLQSEGDMFTAGNDVGEFAAAEPGSSLNEQNVGRFLRALANSSLPLVAAVQGSTFKVPIRQVRGGSERSFCLELADRRNYWEVGSRTHDHQRCLDQRFTAYAGRLEGIIAQRQAQHAIHH